MVNSVDISSNHTLMQKIYQEVKMELQKHGIKEGSENFDKEMIKGMEDHPDTKKLAHLRK